MEKADLADRHAFYLSHYPLIRNVSKREVEMLGQKRHDVCETEYKPKYVYAHFDIEPNGTGEEQKAVLCLPGVYAVECGCLPAELGKESSPLIELTSNTTYLIQDSLQQEKRGVRILPGPYLESHGAPIIFNGSYQLQTDREYLRKFFRRYV